MSKVSSTGSRRHGYSRLANYHLGLRGSKGTSSSITESLMPAHHHRRLLVDRFYSDKLSGRPLTSPEPLNEARAHR
jgi:hypothetical protein